MPLIQFEVRNEFGLGDPELHRGANKDDPKAILDGVAVAGLVGILRQLGDLAQFAAEVFHDLHEQVMATAARSHKTVTRIQRIEAALPTLEKSVLAQTSHIHFAYTAGSEWHADIQTEQNHLVHSDLPQFIMDSYEECRGPPRLFLLDKFDATGAGACLRRYSDPSFFKTTWASSEQAKAQKTQGERRANKSKKRGSRRRSGQSQHATSISQHYSRLQFASPDTDDQSFAAETVTTSNMRSTSKLANRSLSFDSEPGSNYVERVLDVNSSMGPKELEHSTSSTSELRTWYNNTHAPILTDERNGEGADDDFPYKSLKECAADGSSSVTWDEKTEIVKPVSPPAESISQERDQASESLPVSFDQSKLEEAAASLANVDIQDDIVFDVENMPQTFSSRKQFEEVTSETDNYMDALNTIESEIETDSECHTKREVELRSEFKNTGVESGTCGTHEVAAQNSDASDVESPIASCSSSRKEMAPNSTCSIFSESLTHAQPPQISSMAYTLNCSGNTGLCDDVSRLNGFESINDNLPAESNIPNSHGNKIVDDSCIIPESPKNSSIPSVKFWTNGGLLGLEPSKPPDFVVSNAASQNDVPSTNSDRCNLSHHAVVPVLHHDGTENSTTLVKPIEQMAQNSTTQTKREGSPDIVRPSDLHNLPPDQLAERIGNLVRPEYSTSQHDKRDKNMSAERKSPESITAVSEPQPDKLKDSHPSSIFSHTHGAEPPVISNTVLQSSESSQNSIEVSPGLSGITHRFLLNGLVRKTTSLVHGVGDSSELSSADLKKSQERPHQTEQKKWQNGIVTWASHGSSPKEQPRLELLENPTSPPLEHMKISFHPINGVETSKLKLEFPNGHHRLHESIQDVMFPSFQLLPEATDDMQDMGSDSDDDTFYRSSPYPSEDLLSLHSESNSEQWESTELAGSKDDDIYDALRQVPSAASISSSLELEGINHHSTHPAYEFGSLNTENGIGTFESGHLLDLPSFDVVNSPSDLQQKGNDDSKPKGLLDSALQCPNELPPPPPLPPLQWRMMSPGFAVAEDKQQIISEGDSQLNDLQVETSCTTQSKLVQPNKPDISDIDIQPNDLQVQTPVASLQTKPFQPNEPHNEELTACPNKSMKLSESREPNQSNNGKELDEREDFLHQIRTKSFNLRRAVPTRSSSSSSMPTTNTKVSAILEKANAIRQAFTGGDDENWSDG